MNILQFLRIFWARRWIVVAAAVSCVIGGIVVGLVLPPRWQAHSRVLLNLVKPDPETGAQIGPNSQRNYVATQISLIKDYAVAGQVADELGWLSDPNLIAQYDQRPKNDTRDFRRWIAQRVIDNTNVSLVMPDEGGQPSDIIDIGYTATTAGAAQAVADALRTAYVDASLAFDRQEATQGADWYATQAQQAKTALDAASAAKTAYEKENGVILQDNKLDVDSARLQALAQQGAIIAPPTVIANQQNPAVATLSLELDQIDAKIGEDSKVLGPNHPELQDLRAKRAALAGELAKQRSAGSGVITTRTDLGGLDRAVSEEKSKVLGEGDKIAKLRQLQAEVDMRQDQYEKTTAKAAELRQESGATDIGLTPLGAAVAPSSPVFPNWSLILAGSLGLGLAVGLLVALLTELFGRRVRGPEDLQTSVDAPLLAIIGAPASGGARRSLTGAARARRLGGRKLIRA